MGNFQGKYIPLFVQIKTYRAGTSHVHSIESATFPTYSNGKKELPLRLLFPRSSTSWHRLPKEFFFKHYKLNLYIS